MGAMGNFAGKLSSLLYARNAPFILVLPLFLFYILSLTGCTSTSPGIPNLYLVSLNTSSIAPIRVGYFGICATTTSSSVNGSAAMTCHSTAGSSASSAITALYGGTGAGNSSKSSSSSSELTALVTAALALQRSVFIPLLAAAGVLFLAGFVLVLVHKRDNAKHLAGPDLGDYEARLPRRAAIVKRAMLATLGLATALTLTSALATAETAGALAYSTSVNVGSKVGIEQGKPLQILQWVTGLFALVFTAAAPWAAGVRTAGAKM